MTIKPIRSEKDYESALERARALIAKKDQSSVDELDVLQALIEKWERVHHIVKSATPAEAIKFRMSQTGLKPRDLLPYLNSKSRVSEVLSGQRQLTVDQIRALHQHLNIPLESLIGDIKHESAARPSSAALAAVEKLKSMGVAKPRESNVAFLSRANIVAPSLALLRKTRTERTNAKTDFGALEAWCAAVLLKAERVDVNANAKRQNEKSARELAKLSTSSNWHTRVESFLTEAGIALVILEHFPGTYLDGAAMCRSDGAPVIALTLRHDRIDNFWFTLLHEYAHVACHLGRDTPLILDDLEVKTSDSMESEADEFARNALIPPEVWKLYDNDEMDAEDLEAMAREAEVHQAIIAGRWRFEHSDYRRFNRILGRGEVRKLFGTA